MYNEATFVGNLTKDIEFTKTEGGVSIAKAGVATNDRYKTKSGETKDEVCFMDFEMFGGLADVANQYLKKGSRVLLVGAIIYKQWEKDGQKHSKHILRVETMKMLDNKPDEN